MQRILPSLVARVPRRPPAPGVVHAPEPPGLQHLVGNRAVTRLAAGLLLQPKLTVSQPGDVFEQEADRIADQMMRLPEPAVQRACGGCTGGVPCAECAGGQEEHLVQRTPAADGGAHTMSATVVGELGAGRSLEPAILAYFERRFGADFAAVRVHTGPAGAAAARTVQARAFTLGPNVVFGTGEYTPETAGGRRLLAHELVHVIQQGATGLRNTASSVHGNVLTPANGPLIQRALSCSIDHVKNECAKAGATCQTVQDKYCKKRYPKATDIDTLHSNAVTGASGKKKDIPHAADNLLHFLGASGSENVMPVDIFKNHQATKDQLKDVHREKFKEGAEKRLKDGRLAAGGSADMVWTDTANAFSLLKEDDLGLAVGGYTLCSKVKVSASGKSGGGIGVSFDQWTVQAFDCYNWDPGKGIGGLFGAVTDNDLCCLENAGKGRHFRIRTDPWTNTHATGNFTVSPAAAPSGPKPKPPAESGDDR